DDSNNNFTKGTLQATQHSFLEPLFHMDLSHTQALEHGRLQVKILNQIPTANSIAKFEESLSYIWAVFALISLFHILLTLRQKKSIRYIAAKMESLANLNFDAFEQSKTKGEYKIIGQAFEKSQQLLKHKVNLLKEHNEQLTKTAFQDPVTGFGTRARFTEKLNQISDQKQAEVGVLFIIKATELATMNQMVGRDGGDDYLARIANEIRSSLKGNPQASYFRISTADFAIILPSKSLKQGKVIAESLKMAFNEYQQQAGTASIAHIGLVPYFEDTDPVSLMTLADTAVSIAQTLGPNCYHVQEKLTGDELFGESRWKVAINELIRHKAIQFYVQPIRPCRNDVQSYRELLSRFYNSEGKLFPTTTVIAMAERHGMSEELDKLVVLNAIQLLASSTKISGTMGINISSASATNKSFVAWLKDVLIRQRGIAARLVFEVNESGMQTNLSATYHFINELHSVGSRVSIERFGLGFTSFKFFKEVRPDFIKLDHSYTQGICSDPQNRFFVKMIIDISRKLGIRVIATGIEKQDEKLAMEQLLTDGLQGYYIAKPMPLTQEQIA
ncbi:EAL domain-containing protein, partial [Shewanella sairae]